MMTTDKSEFKPRNPVPVGEPIIVHYSGKVPKVTRREYQGRQITEITLWLGIADSNYPDVLFQYHPFIVRAWVSPGKPGNPEATPPVPPQQPSKLYKTILAIAGKEVADQWAYHDAAILEADLLAAKDDAEREALRQKHIAPDQWKALRGFYVADFKEPRKDKETGQPIIAENGGIFWQEVSEVKPLKAARIFNEDQLKASTSWPPPRLEGQPAGQAPSKQADKPAGGIGLPKGNQTPAKAEDEPQEPPKEEPRQAAPRRDMPIADVDNRLRVLITPRSECLRVAREFLAIKKAERVTELPEADRRHLLSLMLIVGHTLADANDPDLDEIRKVVAAFTQGASIASLTPVDADLLRMQLDDIRAGVPF